MNSTTTKKSILFITPDYHCSFMYQEELQKIGWTADVLVPENFPEKLLYATKNILLFPKFMHEKVVGKYLARVLKLIYYIFLIFKYKYHFYYSDLDLFGLGFETKFKLEPFRLHLWLAKAFGVKICYFPSGCRFEFTKLEFSNFDNGNVCNNCGWNSCDDKINIRHLRLVKRYVDHVFGWGTFESPHYKFSHLKYKSLDLNLWSPSLKLPKKFKLRPTENIRILHSFYDENRLNQGKNIKGSPYILNAINKLKNEGYKVEYMYISQVPLNQMRYYQVQADIVVEQLIYGWWGSTGVETMCLGKPVVCYLRPSWKAFFMKKFKEYNNLPIIEANTRNIYCVLKKLVQKKELRKLKGYQSREFAEQHYDVKKNTAELIDFLEVN